jgi:hypothetical protein
LLDFLQVNEKVPFPFALLDVPAEVVTGAGANVERLLIDLIVHNDGTFI